MNPDEQLESLLANSKGAIERFKKKIRINSIARLIAFLMGAYGVYLGWGHAILIIPVLVVFAVLFGKLVHRQTWLRDQVKLETAIYKNCVEELEILAGNWRHRPDGREFLHRDHPYAGDLNIFGPYSIYQYFNRCKTRLARERLADWLCTPLTQPDDINREKNAIAELAGYPGFLIRLISLAEFTSADKELFAEIRQWGARQEKRASPFFRFLTTRLVPAYAIISTLMLMAGSIPFSLYLYSLLIPAAFLAWRFKAHQKQFDEVLKILAEADQFEAVVDLVRTHPFKTPELRALLERVDLSASREGIASLRTVVGAIDSRNNVAVAIVLNLILMWDFQCARRLAKWKRKYGTSLHEWLDLANIFETYASPALYVFDHPGYAYAELTNADTLVMKHARHVLMQPDAVPNSFEFESDRKFIIITGANMAGKSTFLRMVGTNMLLSMRGLPVPVEKFSFQPRNLYTSMLAADSLGENESYFFNELRRLRMMTDKLEAGEPLFVILDEILKGTNSKDKAEGSHRFIQKLLHLPVRGIIATHDLSLCDLGTEFPVAVKNMKFEVGFLNDELDFQYKLEPGVCQNMNASFLLKKMGLTL